MAVVCVSSSGAHAAQGSLARALLGPSNAFFTCQMGYLTLQWPASMVSADIQAHVEVLSTSAARTCVVKTEHMGRCIASSAQSMPRSATLQSVSWLAPAALHATTVHSFLFGAISACAWRLRVESVHRVLFTLLVEGGSLIFSSVVGQYGLSDLRGLCFGTDSPGSDGIHLVCGLHGSPSMAWCVVVVLPVAWAIPGPDPARARLLLGSLSDLVCLVAWAFPEPGPARARVLVPVVALARARAVGGGFACAFFVSGVCGSRRRAA